MKVNKNYPMLAAFFMAGLVIGFGLCEITIRQTSFVGSTNQATQTPTPQLTLDQMYQNAVRDAMVAEQSEIYNNLTAITDTNPNLIWQGSGGNKTVLVVTWTKYNSSYPVGTNVTTWWGETWVTAVPEIKIFFQKRANISENRTLRAEQLLGLPKDKGNLYFIEMWVKTSDLFRPTPDNEINDTIAELNFPASADLNYTTWFNDNIIYSYYAKQFPWTRLGYTYDWGNPQSEIGLSEFVIKKNATVNVNAVIPTNEYLVVTNS
ncbi:MAG: hypothetical protein WC974_01225 [Thermoplasmata archaeon]